MISQPSMRSDRRPMRCGASVAGGRAVRNSSATCRDEGVNCLLPLLHKDNSPFGVQFFLADLLVRNKESVVYQKQEL